MHRSSHPSLLRNPRSPFSIGLIALFAVLIGLAFAQGRAEANDVSPGGTVPNETVPPGTVPPGEGAVLFGLVNVIHAAPVDSDVNNTAVDICAVHDNAKVLGPLLYEEQSGYQPYDIGEYAWFVAPAGSDCATSLHDIPPFPLYSATTLTIVIYGGANGHPLASVAIAGNEGLRVQLMPVMRHEP